MRCALVLIIAFIFTFSTGQALWAQTPVTNNTDSSQWPVPSKEAFLNAVIPLLIDTPFSGYYLYETADTSDFIKFDYDEWVKYHLRETVSIVFLNELAEKAYHDKGPSCWQQDKLDKAICVDWKKGSSIINPFQHIYDSITLSRKEKKIAVRRLEKERDRLPLSKKVVYGFSRPEFTDDGRYALIDMTYDCGRECATSYICIFRQTGAGWKMIGKAIAWQS